MDLNPQLASFMILSLVSDFTPNMPWVSGEVQLAQKSFALPYYGVCLYDLTRSSVSQKAPTFSDQLDKQSL